MTKASGQQLLNSNPPASLESRLQAHLQLCQRVEALLEIAVPREGRSSYSQARHRFRDTDTFVKDVCYEAMRWLAVHGHDVQRWTSCFLSVKSVLVQKMENASISV
jgi:hypothetical protein